MTGVISKYNRRTWLNPVSSDSTGAIVAFNGEVTDLDTGNRYPQLFLEISDCHHKIRLHQTSDDTTADFIDKIKLLRAEIDLFITHLEEENK